MNDKFDLSKDNSKVFAVRLSCDLICELEYLSNETGKTIPGLVRFLIHREYQRIHGNGGQVRKEENEK